MKILVFSDSHGMWNNIKEAINAHKRKADLIIHLGDGSADLDMVSDMCKNIPVCRVAGNHEEFTTPFSMRDELQFEVLYNFDGVKIFATHGHKYGVKSGYSRIINVGKSKDADLILFGHTHKPEEHSVMPDDENGKYIKIFNPGSIGRGYECTYGVIEIVNGNIITGFGKILHK